jgi:colanic acid biosynthesis glycosyl transferase WcaI
MLSSGRPVLATADPQTQVGRVIAGDSTHDACGLIVPAEDFASLQAAARKLVSDATLRNRLGENARRYAVEHLGRDQVLLRFEQSLRELVR